MQMIVDARGETVDYRFPEANAAFGGHTGLVDPIGKTALELVPDLDASWFELYGGRRGHGAPGALREPRPGDGPLVRGVREPRR